MAVSPSIFEKTDPTITLANILKLVIAATQFFKYKLLPSYKRVCICV